MFQIVNMTYMLLYIKLILTDWKVNFQKSKEVISVLRVQAWIFSFHWNLEKWWTSVRYMWYVIFEMIKKLFIIIYILTHYDFKVYADWWLTYVLLTSNWKFFFIMLPAVNPTKTEGMPTSLEPEENNNDLSP